jgi:hypothetical protein
MSPTSSTAKSRTTKKPDSAVLIRKQAADLVDRSPCVYKARRNASAVPAGEVRRKCGAIAQLGERFNGIEEVVGSIPSGSTKQYG